MSKTKKVVAGSGISLAIVVMLTSAFDFGRDLIASQKSLQQSFISDSTRKAQHEIWVNNTIDSMQCAGIKLSKDLKINLKNCN